MGGWLEAMESVQSWYLAAPVPRVALRLGDRQFEALAAITPGQWAKGLAGHSPDESMLFIMPSGSRYAFGMRGIDHPLAIGFYDDSGRRVDIGFMRERKGFKTPRQPYRYALEVPTGNIAGICGLLEGQRLEIGAPCQP